MVSVDLERSEELLGHVPRPDHPAPAHDPADPAAACGADTVKVAVARKVFWLRAYMVFTSQIEVSHSFLAEASSFFEFFHPLEFARTRWAISTRPRFLPLVGSYRCHRRL